MHLSKDKQFIQNLEKLNRGINYKEISHLFSNFFHLNENQVFKEATYFLSKTLPIAKDQFELAIQWHDVTKGLPEKDQVDIEKTATLIEYIYHKFADQWERLLNQVTSTVKINMKQFLVAKV